MKGPSRSARVRERLAQLQLFATFEKQLAKALSKIIASQIRTLAKRYRTEHHITETMLVGQNAIFKQALIATYKRVTTTFAARIRRLHKSAFDTAILDWITNRALETITNVNETTLSTIQTIIKDGVTNGLGVDAIARQIDDAADDMEDDSGTRACVIARTEVHTAANYANLEAAKDAGVVTYKTWTASSDARTREAHQEADGQTVPVDQPFDVDGEDVDHPGDGSPENSVNCRCVMVFSTGSKDESDSDT
jgi:SPP1 gp7 family putative phage head morphogenesis protein